MLRTGASFVVPAPGRPAGCRPKRGAPRGTSPRTGPRVDRGNAERQVQESGNAAEDERMRVLSINYYE